MSSITRASWLLERRGTLVLAVVSIAAFWALLSSLAATSALAAHAFTGAFGGPCTGAGSTCEPGQLEEPLKEPSGVAVDEETGDVFVVDKGNDRVVVFNAAGTKLEGEFNGSGLLAGEGREAGSGGLPGEIKTGKFENPEGIAVDNSTSPSDPSRGDVYVVDTGHQVVDKFSATGAYEGQLTEACEKPEEVPPCGGSAAVRFVELAGVGVDLAGDVWVSQENGHIYEFNGAVVNESVSQVFSPSEGSPGFAVDARDDLYFHHAGVFEELSSTETEEERAKVLKEAVDPEASTGAAVDLSNNDVYIDNVLSIGEFSRAGSEIDRFGEGHLTAGSGVGVDPRIATVYAGDSTAGTASSFVAPVAPAVLTGEATGTQSEGVATLNGLVDARGTSISSCEFEYVSEVTLEEQTGKDFAELIKAGFPEGLILGVGSRVACEAPVIPEDQVFHPVEAVVSGLTPGVGYHFGVVAANADGSEPEVGEARAFFSVAHPQLSGEAATAVASTSATLNARIDPEGLETSYSFEYGTSTEYGNSAPVPAGELAAATSGVSVSQPINGLSADTTYHWRLVAHNHAGTSTGPDHTFIYNTTGPGLPEGREYEMVTPPFKNGSLAGSAQVLTIASTVSEDGTRLIRTIIQCFAGAQSCPALRGGHLGTLYQFERTPAGWVTTPLPPPATQFQENSVWGGNATSGMALFSMPTAPLGEEDLYLRKPEGTFTDIGPLTEPSKGEVAMQDQATPDGSKVAFEFRPEYKWLFDGTTGEETTSRPASLYEYSGTANKQPVLVGVTGGPGSTDLISSCSTYFGEPFEGAAATGSSVAEDGTIFFTAAKCAKGGTGANAGIEVKANTLYARVAGSETVKLSGHFAPDCNEPACEDSEPSAAAFQGASGDGSRAFFTSTQQLTDQATAGSGSAESCEVGADCNLYEAELAKNGGGVSEVKSLIAVSAGDTSGNGPRVQGVMAVSPDGSHVYFVAQAVLTGEERPGCKAGFEAAGESEEGRCHPVEGANNMYVFERESGQAKGHLAFVATLSSTPGNIALNLEPDSLQWGAAGGSRANVTPDGRYLVFTSDARLTADDTDGRQAQQIFRYDAATGGLVRVSIGALGFNDNGNAAAADAAIVSPGGAGNLVGSPRSDPTMSHDGSYVFFMSPVGLTAQALNEVPVAGTGSSEHLYAQNVYEYHEGHVYLISDGHDTAAERTTCGREVKSLQSAVCLVGSDATGRNVFFTTADPLVRGDVDTQLDVYDARVCGAEGCVQSPAVAAPACLGEECHGVPAAAPAVPGVPSVSFNGAGNSPPLSSVVVVKPVTNAQKLARALRACRLKRGRHKRAVCEAEARKRYGPKSKKSAKKSGYGARRAGR